MLNKFRMACPAGGPDLEELGSDHLLILRYGLLQEGGRCYL